MDGLDFNRAAINLYPVFYFCSEDFYLKRTSDYNVHCILCSRLESSVCCCCSYIYSHRLLRDAVSADGNDSLIAVTRDKSECADWRTFSYRSNCEVVPGRKAARLKSLYLSAEKAAFQSRN